MHWRELLLLFGTLWAMQVAGTVLQMRHYRRILAGLMARWSDGFIGSGSARSRFGRGAIAIVVASPDLLVRRAMAMEGRTVWAKFHDVALPRGVDLEGLRTGAVLGARERRLAEALRHAVEQIDVIRAQRAGGPPAIADVT